MVEARVEATAVEVTEMAAKIMGGETKAGSVEAALMVDDGGDFEW